MSPSDSGLARHALAVAVGAVRRAQVLEHHLLAFLDDARVIARDAVVDQAQVGLVAAADHQLRLLELVHLADVGARHHHQVSVVLGHVVGRPGAWRGPGRVVERIADALSTPFCYFTDRRGDHANAR